MLFMTSEIAEPDSSLDTGKFCSADTSSTTPAILVAHSLACCLVARCHIGSAAKLGMVTGTTQMRSIRGMQAQ